MNKRYLTRCVLTVLCCVSGRVGATAPGPALFIADDGKPNSQIVIAAENRPRMATLAALELQRGIQKISGARLPIVTVPDSSMPVKIYVGKSPETEKLGVKDDDLKYGAFRMLSGADWLVLLGGDKDFNPGQYPVALNRSDRDSADAEWDKAVKESGLTDATWNNPVGGGYKAWWNPSDFDKILDEQYGDGSAALWKTGGNTISGRWPMDENGSLNAVCEFLRGLGMRWFMSGELGEIVPKMTSIELPKLDRTEKPDFPVRSYTWNNYPAFPYDDVIWALRLGINSAYGKLGLTGNSVHGLTRILTGAMSKTHPEYYAFLNGKRVTDGDKAGFCYSSPGLFKETVNYVRFLFDKYDEPAVSIGSNDGFKPCECDGCKGKTPPEMVWEFNDRVAREVYKTHPDRKVMGSAYQLYNSAPDSIEKFSPNLGVIISNSGRVKMMDPEFWSDYKARVMGFQSKMSSGSIFSSENNRYHVWGRDDAILTPKGGPARGAPISYPAIHPHAMARNLKFLRELGTMGENGEQSQVGKWKVMGLEHITLYVQSRFLWDADLDVDQVLDEYFTMFYGPAAKQMKEAIDFAENNMAIKDESKRQGRGNPTNVSLKTALKLRDLLDKAKAAAGNSIYGQRVQAVIACLQPRDALIAKYKKIDETLAEQRTKAPLCVGVADADLSKAKEYSLRDAKTNLQTTFKVGWVGKTLLLDIVCKEPDMKALQAIDEVNKGDYVAVSLETQNHSYYQISVNPDGKLLEGNPNPGWGSLADVKTEKGVDFWRVQLSILTVGDDEALADPNHSVAGAKPTTESPWYFNVSRQRKAGLDEGEKQSSYWAGGSLNVPASFGRLEIE